MGFMFAAIKRAKRRPVDNFQFFRRIVHTIASDEFEPLRLDDLFGPSKSQFSALGKLLEHPGRPFFLVPGSKKHRKRFVEFLKYRTAIRER